MLERRSKRRFPLNMPLKFTAGAAQTHTSGTGTVVDISSGGFAFRAEPPLHRGLMVTASVSWPALLNDECLLQLLLEGEVIRVDGPLAVMRIKRSEFRTSGRAGKSVRNEAAALERQFERLVFGEASSKKA